MGKKEKRTGQGKKTGEKENKLKLIFDAHDDEASEDEDIYEGADSGMLLGKEDVQLIYNALKEYQPTPDEENLHMVWLEMFEETLVVDYGEPYPDAN
jgi:hypothetical protein